MMIKRECPTCGRQYIDALVVGTAIFVATVLMWLGFFVYLAYQPRIDCCAKINEIRKIIDDD